jgi:ElaB/YqjD/DUF883 family membrane-anchored ribosome-binding protein
MAQASSSSSSTRSTQDLEDKTTGGLSGMAEKAADTVREAAGQAGEAAGRAAEQVREAGSGLQDMSGNLKSAVDKSLKDQPMATLALAAALGFVLGAIWKS